MLVPVLILKSQFQASRRQFYTLASVGKVESKGAYAFATFCGLIFCY